MSCKDYFLPAQAVEYDTNGAKNLRQTCMLLIVGHFFSGIIGFAFVSVFTFLGQGIYIALLYSIYMTLHVWMVWAYCVIIACNAISGVLSLLTMADGQIWYILILIFYAAAAKKMFHESEEFRAEKSANSASKGNFL